jgi:hypothetical protein
VLLLNSQKMVPLAPKSLEVFKERPDLNTIVAWAYKLKVKELTELQVMPIDIPISRII